MLALLVHVRGLLHGLDRLGVVAHREQHVALADVRLDELGVDLDRLFRILQRLRECSKLRVCVRAVVVATRVVRVALDRFGVRLDRSCEVASLEQSIALLAGGSSLLGVNVLKTGLLCLFTLGLAELVEDVWRTVFRERFLEELDGGGEVALALVCAANAAVRLSDQLEICTDLRNEA